MKNKRRYAIVSIILIFTIMVTIVIIWHQSKPKIVFNDEYYIEYGKEVDYKKMIKEIDTDKEVVYPKNISFDKVGIYDLEFKFKDSSYTIKHQVKVRDTSPAIIHIYFDSSGLNTALVGDYYDVLGNIQGVKGISDDKYWRVATHKVSEDEYYKIYHEVRSIYNELQKRKVTSKTKQPIQYANQVFYKTNFNIEEEGVYYIDVFSVDENYNTYEETWGIEVLSKEDYDYRYNQ